jgi:hypothetical protein
MEYEVDINHSATLIQVITAGYIFSVYPMNTNRNAQLN